MNIVKERRKQRAVCNICRSPDYHMTPPIEGETTKPAFTCHQCGHGWTYGRDGGKYAELSTPNVADHLQAQLDAKQAKVDSLMVADESG